MRKKWYIIYFLSKIGEKTLIFKEFEGRIPMSKWEMNRLRTRDRFSYLDCPTGRVLLE
uniref:hypothetical protein n=1 Tax=Priestia koreensis TaxID=284581 RepID=UPI003F499BD9